MPWNRQEREGFGVSVLRLRERYSLTQEEFAARVDVERNTVSRWELGLNAPRRAELRRVCSEFGVAVSDLVPLASSDIAAGNKSADLLGPIPSSFSASALEGLWVTSFTFTHLTHHRDPVVRHHADVVRITAQSDRGVLGTNHFPEPRTEGRTAPFRNEIGGELVNRHLVGQWRNLSDTRYFGTLHLAVMPGETVMRGVYSGFASDIDVSTGSWNWVRLEPTDQDLAVATLKDPQEISALLEAHLQYEAPLSLMAVKED